MLSSLQAQFARIPRSAAWIATGLIFAIGIIPFAPYIADAAQGARLHAPNLALLADRPPQLLIHLGSALTALAIGIVIMLRPKGRGMHKTLGWTWVIAMTSTAISSLFITSLSNTYTLLHLFAGWTIIALPMAVVAIRRGNIKAHRQGMTGLFVGGLLIAGGLTFLPGRLMWNIFFG